MFFKHVSVMVFFFFLEIFHIAWNTNHLKSTFGHAMDMHLDMQLYSPNKLEQRTFLLFEDYNINDVTVCLIMYFKLITFQGM